MSFQQRLSAHRSVLREAEAGGLSQVKTSTLHEIFNDLEAHSKSPDEQSSAVELEKFRSDLAGSLAYHEQIHDWNLENFRQVIALGQSALKSAMLINGGAAVALLAFLGNLVTGSSSVAVLPFANSLGSFVLGVFFGAVAYGTTYLSQLLYGCEKPWHRVTAITLHVITVLAVGASLAVFLVGARAAYSGFVGIAP